MSSWSSIARLYSGVRHLVSRNAVHFLLSHRYLFIHLFLRLNLSSRPGYLDAVFIALFLF